MLDEYSNSDVAILELQNFFTEYVSVSNTTLAYVDYEIVGGVNLNIASDSADIVFLFITEKYRGEGRSNLMMEETLKYLKDKNVKNVFLEVDTSNSIAIKLYEKFEFKEINRRKNYYQNGNDAILMKREL